MANIFLLAKAYQKKHPRTAWQDCIQAVKKSPKKPAVKKSVVKKAPERKAVSGTPKKAKPAKVTIKVKKGSVKATIGSISLQKVATEQRHQEELQRKIDANKGAMKIKGITAAEKAMMTKTHKALSEAFKASRTYTNQLKKLL